MVTLCDINTGNVVKYSASKHQQLLLLCCSNALEGKIFIIRL